MGTVDQWRTLDEDSEHGSGFSVPRSRESLFYHRLLSCRTGADRLSARPSTRLPLLSVHGRNSPVPHFMGPIRDPGSTQVPNGSLPTCLETSTHKAIFL